jgi:hypothetical protein
MRWLALIVVGMLMIHTRILAQEAGAQPETEPASSLPFSFDASLDYKTLYVFRGYKIMDGSEGLIFQPAGQLTLNRMGNDSLGVAPYAGVWTNFTTNPTGDKNWENWSEADLSVGAEIDCGKWSLDASFIEYLYPNGSTRSAGEVGLVLGYDDGDLSAKCHLPFALNPHLGFYQQVYDDADNHAKSYLELGIRPEFEKACGVDKLTISFPINLGMSTDKTYTTDDGGNEFWGYASAAVELKYQITEHWFIKAGVEYDYLMANSVRQANEESSHLVVGTVGVGFSL